MSDKRIRNQTILAMLGEAADDYIRRKADMEVSEALVQRAAKEVELLTELCRLRERRDDDATP